MPSCRIWQKQTGDDIFQALQYFQAFHRITIFTYAHAGAILIHILISTGSGVSMKRALRAAFPHTIPVLTGYLFMGFAFGVLFRQTGRNPLLAVALSVIVYAGSLQFMAVIFLKGGVDLLTIFLMSLLINARHMFYGLPFIERFKHAGRKKPYMIFSLTDETFSLLCSARPPLDVDETSFFFSIALLDQFYWVVGSALGAAAGAILPFDTKGIEFAMTALFVVIFIEQWRSMPTQLPALTGIFVSLAALILFGGGSFILPAMAAIVAVLSLLKKPVERKLDALSAGEEAEPCRAQDTR